MLEPRFSLRVPTKSPILQSQHEDEENSSFFEPHPSGSFIAKSNLEASSQQKLTVKPGQKAIFDVHHAYNSNSGKFSSANRNPFENNFEQQQNEDYRDNFGPWVDIRPPSKTQHFPTNKQQKPRELPAEHFRATLSRQIETRSLQSSAQKHRIIKSSSSTLSAIDRKGSQFSTGRLRVGGPNIQQIICRPFSIRNTNTLKSCKHLQKVSNTPRKCLQNRPYTGTKVAEVQFMSEKPIKTIERKLAQVVPQIQILTEPSVNKISDQNHNSNNTTSRPLSQLRARPLSQSQGRYVASVVYNHALYSEQTVLKVNKAALMSEEREKLFLKSGRILDFKFAPTSKVDILLDCRRTRRPRVSTVDLALPMPGSRASSRQGPDVKSNLSLSRLLSKY